MKLHVLSDLHLGMHAMDPPATEADVVVLAGDVSRPREAAAYALRFGKPVVFVLGNHEFYGGSIDGATVEMKRLCAGTPVHLLDDDETVIDGMRFVGATLWTDFELFGDPQRRAAAIDEAKRCIRDFSRIRRAESSSEPFSPEDAAALCRRHAAGLERRLAQPHDGPTVVVTHHAPSPRSIHPRFTDSLINACFVSDLERLLDGRHTPLWIHGHTHDSFDYAVNGTRVLCNPRGYAPGGVVENAGFDPHLVVEVR